LTTEQTDHDNIAYWGITPEELAEHVIYAIDQPWGVVVSDITVRASGDLFVI
jgi:NADP-dependent 3-hydroxy acid dehydrogenase YdfG